MEEFVNVSVRIRPCFREEIQSSCLQVINKHPPVLLVLDKSQTYHFDNIFEDDVNQEDIFNDTVKRLVEKVKAGYNCTVFAYGQTGTGKSYTIGTNPDTNHDDEAGLISRTLDDFFNPNSRDDVEIEISFIEIYNEKVFDLLDPENKALRVKGFAVQGFRKVKVYNKCEALECLKSGTNRRHTGETKQNSKSSRSHAIFSIYCCTKYNDRKTVAKLNLVDLAGSESVKKTGNRGSSFYEGININKGLLSLGQVMTALSTNSSHIPYRQSVITTILQDSLNKKNFISLIACVSSNPEDLGETLQTLEFSSRVKKMKNKPELNEFIVQYKKENPSLFINSLPRGQTPVKRANGFAYETPFKKPRNALPPIKEPTNFQNNLSYSISPLFSSSLTSAMPETPSLSPVIKKYMTAMESSLMSKLEDVIKNTLKRDTNTSSKKLDKENLFTPRTARAALSKTSTPEVTDENDSFTRSDYNSNPKSKVLSPNNSNLLKSENLCISLKDEPMEPTVIPKSNLDNDFVFKMPTNRAIRKVQKTARISETTSFAEATSSRRSVRLQLKQNTLNNISEDNSEALEKSCRRRSVRLQAKRQSIMEKKTTSSGQSKKQETPCVNCSNNKRTNRNYKDSPITARTKQVLKTLNTGSLKEIEKLHTVGAKTAEKILLFRQIKGKFESVSEMSEMPYWSSKKYDKFLLENFLRR